MFKLLRYKVKEVIINNLTDKPETRKKIWVGGATWMIRANINHLCRPQWSDPSVSTGPISTFHNTTIPPASIQHHQVSPFQIQFRPFLKLLASMTGTDHNFKSGERKPTPKQGLRYEDPIADCPAMSFVFVCWHINIRNTNQSWGINW